MVASVQRATTEKLIFCDAAAHIGQTQKLKEGGAGRPNKYTKAKTINQIQFNGYFYVWFRCFLLACSLQAMCALDHISIATCAGNENLALHLPVAAVKVASKLKTVSTFCRPNNFIYRSKDNERETETSVLVLLHTCQRYSIMVAHCFNFPVQCSLLNSQGIFTVGRSSQKLGGLSSGGS